MHEDFDIDSLAKYLHLQPTQVMRMADREKLPGRKISGQWRFSRAEIHHWLEERIGASTEGELEKVEQVLERDTRIENASQICLAALIPDSGVAVPLQARTRGSVIKEMSELAANAGFLWDSTKMEQAVRERENLHPTALDNGVALLHPRRPLANILAEPCLMLGRTVQGIPFGGSRGNLTDVFFLICSTEDGVHLRVLARLSRLLQAPRFLEDLRLAPDAAEVRRLIVDTEGEL